MRKSVEEKRAGLESAYGFEQAAKVLGTDESSLCRLSEATVVSYWLPESCKIAKLFAARNILF